jgi:DNA-binding PucR family transcriptional regulator
VLQDELLATSLRQLYLDPLRGERDGGVVAMNTLRAYFAASGNASSAAAALGISRRTVGSRLAAIEDRLDLRLDAASAEIETALRLDEIEGRAGPETQPG